MKNIYFIIISIIVLLYFVSSVRKKKLPIKESFWWVMASIVMLLLSIFPYSIDWLADKLNVAYPPSLFFVICIVFLVMVLFKNSKKIAAQQEKITELAQELAILRNKVEDKNGKK